MSIKTGRAEGKAQVTINYDKCSHCGFCADICCGTCDGPLYVKDGQVVIDQSRLFGCIGCGHCMAICPHNCICVEGRTISHNDAVDFPHAHKPTYTELYTLLFLRRSIRRFKDKEVEQELIDKIIDAVTTAPVGLPPSDVEILIFKGHKKVQLFAHDLVEAIYKRRFLFSPMMRPLLRPFVGKEFMEICRTYMYPTMNFLKKAKDKGHDWLFYNAPVLMYFHVSPYGDAVDPLISAAYAMLTAESLGLGGSLIGTPTHFLKHNNTLKKKYKIPLKNQQGIAFIMGYPKYEFKKGIKRTISYVRYY
ncbi:MAG: nitroreductase family protein [bacterium]